MVFFFRQGTANTVVDDDGSSGSSDSTAPGGEGERDPEEESLTSDECIDISSMASY